MQYVVGVFIFLYSMWGQAGLIERYKAYPSERFRQKLNLPTEKIVLAIQSEGIHVETFTSGPLGKKWSPYFFQNKVLGKYFSPYGFSQEVKRPTILTRDLTDRWTLLHEYLHALFDQERHRKNQMHDAKVFEQQQNAREDFLELYPKRSDPNVTKDLIQVFDQYVNFEIEVSMALSIEEILIEVILTEAYMQPADYGLTPLSAKTARHYIQSNVTTILGYLEKFHEIGIELKQAQATVQKIESLQAELIKLTGIQ